MKNNFTSSEYDICYPNYENSIVNVSSAILAYFGVKPKNKPNELLLQKLTDGKYEKVVLLVLDGLGSYNIEKCLTKDSFLARNKIQDISSVFPPTTIAAINSIVTETTPNEHCWLGWDRWFDKEKVLESGFVSSELTNKYFPTKLCWDRLTENGIANTSVSPFAEIKKTSLKGITEQIAKLTQKSKCKFIYGYFSEPDSTMHKMGTDSAETKQLYANIDKIISAMQRQIKDKTAIIIIADHGLIDSKSSQHIEDFEELTACLSAPPSLEPTAISFRIKAGYNSRFEAEFNRNVKGYKLFTRQEVLDLNLFGTSIDNPKLGEAIGDYLAISIGDNVVWYNDCNFKAFHAGLHMGEMIVPIIFFDECWS